MDRRANHINYQTKPIPALASAALPAGAARRGRRPSQFLVAAAPAPGDTGGGLKEHIGMAAASPVIGIIGGSGLYQIHGFTDLPRPPLPPPFPHPPHELSL